MYRDSRELGNLLIHQPLSFTCMDLAKQLAEARYISLETYRKSGVAVRTTVWLVEAGGQIYIRTDPNSGKAKRIRRNPRVRVARSDMGGNVKGDWAEGEATQVDQKESEKVRELFRKKYGMQIRLLGVISRLPGGHRDDSLVLGIRLANHPQRGTFPSVREKVEVGDPVHDKNTLGLTDDGRSPA